MATRIADQVAAALGGRSLKTVQECTVDNPLGLPQWSSWGGATIRSVLPGERIYATYEATPYARAQLEVLKFMVGSAYDLASFVPKVVAPFKVPTNVLESVSDVFISLKERKEGFDRSLRDINNEQMQQVLIKNESEMFDRFTEGIRNGSAAPASIDDPETLP